MKSTRNESKHMRSGKESSDCCTSGTRRLTGKTFDVKIGLKPTYVQKVLNTTNQT